MEKGGRFVETVPKLLSYQIVDANCPRRSDISSMGAKKRFEMSHDYKEEYFNKE